LKAFCVATPLHLQVTQYLATTPEDRPRFAAPPEPDNAIVGCGVHIITPNAGLRSPDTYVTRRAIRAFATTDVDPDNASYRRPLETSARALALEVGPDCDVVLLGSVASPKYVSVLLDIFGDRLRFLFEPSLSHSSNQGGHHDKIADDRHDEGNGSDVAEQRDGRKAARQRRGEGGPPVARSGWETGRRVGPARVGREGRA